MDEEINLRFGEVPDPFSADDRRVGCKKIVCIIILVNYISRELGENTVVEILPKKYK